jgi:type II secretory pathway component PulC
MMMKHPFWILNLALLVLVLSSFTFVYFSKIKITSRENIEPEAQPVRKESRVAVNIQKIYENDLFGTYIKEAPKQSNIKTSIPFPTPPQQQRIVAPKIIEPEFLEPLPISLLGIIVVSSQDSKNRAIIQDDKTKQENTYKVGDFLQDAQLIRIFKNKVVLLRLNGQQEVLYLREQDAKSDTAHLTENDWTDAIKKVDDYHYIVDPEEFVHRVNNLAEFITALNATTAYLKGKSVGLRVGTLSTPALGAALGLQKGDIITHINNIPSQTIEERLAIYKNIITLPLGHTIKVNIMRRNRNIVIEYKLDKLSLPTEQEQESLVKEPSFAFLSHSPATHSEQQHKQLSHTVQKVRNADRMLVLKNGPHTMNIRS